jgi:hypothetical protein
MFDKDLLVLEEFDASKTIDEYRFDTIPIWVRVFKILLGDMDQDTGELIGNQIGDFIEMDGLVDGMAVGQFLRIKVRMSIKKPIMRGTMIEVEGGKRTIWCPFEYEYCPDFCFVCGRIGHVEKECSIKLKRGEEPQYGRWLRWVPPRKQLSAENRWSWGSGGGGRRQRSWGSGGGRSGSDAPSWKKPGVLSGNSSKSMEGEKEVTSPLKITDGQGADKGNAKKVLQFGAPGKNQKQDEVAESVEKEGGKGLAVGGTKGRRVNVQRLRKGWRQ